MSYAGVVDRGFVQAITADANCSWLENWLGTCVLPTGADVQAAADAPYTCNWLQNMWNPTACASAQSQGSSQGPIAPLAPVVSTIDPNSGDVTMLTPAQQQALNVAAITNNASQTAGVDCSLWYNQMFNAKCPCTSCQSIFGWLGVGLAAFVLLSMVKK